MVEGKSSIKQIREATGASKGTINNQRRVLAELKAENPVEWQSEITGLSWQQVLRMVNNQEFSEADENRARQELAKRFLKSIPPHILRDNPVIVFDALIDVCPSLGPEGVDYFSGLDAYKTYYEMHRSEIDNNSEF